MGLGCIVGVHKPFFKSTHNCSNDQWYYLKLCTSCGIMKLATTNSATYRKIKQADFLDDFIYALIIAAKQELRLRDHIKFEIMNRLKKETCNKKQIIDYVYNEAINKLPSLPLIGSWEWKHELILDIVRDTLCQFVEIGLIEIVPGYDPVPLLKARE